MAVDFVWSQYGYWHQSLLFLSLIICVNSKTVAANEAVIDLNPNENLWEKITTNDNSYQRVKVYFKLKSAWNWWPERQTILYTNYKFLNKETGTGSLTESTTTVSTTRTTHDKSKNMQRKYIFKKSSQNNQRDRLYTYYKLLNKEEFGSIGDTLVRVKQHFWQPSKQLFCTIKTCVKCKKNLHCWHHTEWPVYTTTSSHTERTNSVREQCTHRRT